MSENLKDLRARFQRWRSALEGKGLKVNIGKTKMMVSGTENAIALSKIEPCGICGKRVVSNAVCCTDSLSTCPFYVEFWPTGSCCCGLDVMITFLNYDIKNLIVVQKTHNNKPT